MPAEFRQVWPEHEVTRRVNRPWSRIERLLSDPERFPVHAVPLGARGTLRLGERIDTSPGGVRDPWRARGRVIGRGPRLVRFSRIDVVITPWSTDTCELRVVPRSRSLHRWGGRRSRRYWRLAHAAADALLSILMREPRPERCDEQLQLPTSATLDARAVRGEAVLAREG